MWTKDVYTQVNSPLCHRDWHRSKPDSHVYPSPGHTHTPPAGDTGQGGSLGTGKKEKEEWKKHKWSKMSGRIRKVVESPMSERRSIDWLMHEEEQEQEEEKEKE